MNAYLHLFMDGSSVAGGFEHSKLLGKIMSQTIFMRRPFHSIPSFLSPNILSLALFSERNWFISRCSRCFPFFKCKLEKFYFASCLLCCWSDEGFMLMFLKQWRCKNVINSLIFMYAKGKALDEHFVHKFSSNLLPPSPDNRYPPLKSRLSMVVRLPLVAPRTTGGGAQWNNKINDDENAGWRSGDEPGRHHEEFSPIMFDGEKFLSFMCCSSWFMFETWFFLVELSPDVKQMLYFPKTRSQKLDHKLCHYGNFYSGKVFAPLPISCGPGNADKFWEEWKINGTLWRTFHVWLNFYQFRADSHRGRLDLVSTSNGISFSFFSRSICDFICVQQNGELGRVGNQADGVLRSQVSFDYTSCAEFSKGICWNFLTSLCSFTICRKSWEIRNRIKTSIHGKY